MYAFVNKILLFPYYLVLAIRNRWFDKGILHSSSFDIPIISIGNITVGGTGKTPHTEMFVKEYLKKGKVGVISLGYGRKGRGLKIVDEYDKASTVGDEPLQIKRKFPQATVIVSKNRCAAVKKMMELPQEKRPDVIILDDGFQYRKLKPSKSVLLIPYNRPVFKDFLLPFGRLRDIPSQIKRADTVIFTKCPSYLNEWDREKIIEANRVGRHHKTSFTTIEYCQPLPVFSDFGNNRFIYSQEAILITGIADNTQIKMHVLSIYREAHFLSYPDHHKFTKSDVRQIVSLAEAHPRAVLLTTEKDAQRFVFETTIPKVIRERLFYIPIETAFLEGVNEDIF
ncbi:MAG: tetraacyldisaccharide 4'-kinase [Bacteroidales bacterium]|nr:tetraacyldisaccharide 4'-kinase [Bacteroidales bacterium]